MTPEPAMQARNPLGRLGELGQSVWYDYITRDLLTSGRLHRLIREDGLRGMTSNPTIFEKAIAGSQLYDEDIRRLNEQGKSPADIFETIAVADVQAACDAFAPLYLESGKRDGFVSLEVSPRLAQDSEATLQEARRLWKALSRPNAMIKIPGTRGGLSAIAQAIAAGMNVNVTLLFSVERYAEVIEAFLAGLEQAQANGKDISKIHSVASFFVSRVDTEVDKRLTAIGTDEAAELKSLAGVANARLAYELFEKEFATDRAKALTDAGAHVQRPLWASTGVKDPSLPDTLYVTELVAPGTVNTMPEKTLEATFDHGQIAGDAVTGTYEAAHKVFADLAAVGVDFADVTQVLEDEGVDKFIASWHDLQGTVKTALEDALQGTR